MNGDEGMIAKLGREAREAASLLSQCDDVTIDSVLVDLEAAILSGTSDILSANLDDLQSSKEKELSVSMTDRLTLTPDRVKAMAESVRDIRALKNPCGEILEEWTRPNGLLIQKVSVPIGVLGMIYESRPNVTIDAAALALKSRNAIILRGGSESFRTSAVLHKLLQKALIKNGLPSACVGFVTDRDRALVGDMLNAVGLIDVIIPRGGKNLTGRVMSDAKMPVFAHLDGNCHVYVHESANRDSAITIIKNAKLRRTGICGAAESLLLDSSLDKTFIRNVLHMLLDEGVEILGDATAISHDPRIKPATEDDWSAEYLDKKISVKFVRNVQEAVNHINKYGSHHTDSILSTDDAATDYFLTNVDSAIVIRNASTQFADGGEFGFGAEIGIGTGKLHARGPVGVRQLTTFKYKILGDGQIRP